MKYPGHRSNDVQTPGLDVIFAALQIEAWRGVPQWKRCIREPPTGLRALSLPSHKHPSRGTPLALFVHGGSLGRLFHNHSSPDTQGNMRRSGPVVTTTMAPSDVVSNMWLSRSQSQL